VVILATPEVSALEVAGAAEVFALAGRKLHEAGRPHSRGYQVRLLTCSPETQPLGSAVGLRAEGSFESFTEPIDTLLVAGGLEPWSGRGTPGLHDWLRTHARQARRYGSLCTGAFVLAEAGLLDGHRVTTHWYFCERLAREFPRVTVDSEPIFVRADPLWTAAGVTAGIDMALAMVEDDLGLDTALRIARALVVYVRRPGWQSQFSTALATQTPRRARLAELPFWILEHLGQPLSVPTLAERMAMSPRNFTRRFVEEFGTPPLRFVTRLRVEAAARLIAENRLSRGEIAEACGFGSIDSLDRALREPAGAGATELSRTRPTSRRNPDPPSASRRQTRRLG
jgi:transcriptional regulator GlxA family with amidase domain